MTTRQGNPQTQTFGYDSLNCLTGASASGGTSGNGNYNSESYTYNDNTGNLQVKAGATNTYTFATSTSCVGGSRTLAHAVSAVSGGEGDSYDCNGNATTWVTGGGLYMLSYDAENRLVGVKKNDVSIASFVYNGDGARVKGVITETQTTTTLFVGGYFEWMGSKSTMMRYYTAGGMRLALRVGDGTGSSGLSYLFGDHLGSTSVTYRISDTLTTRQLYKAWGEPSYASASLPTKYTYTGQYTHMDDLATGGVTEGFGMMFYNARWYDPARQVEPAGYDCTRISRCPIMG